MLFRSLFNTPTRLFLLDGNGNDAGRFPIRLPAVATNGCTMANTPTNYNIYVACSNHYIYAYEAGGKPVSDWNYMRTENNVTKPVQVFQGKQNTYIVVNEDSGIVVVTDKKGNQLSSFKGKFYQSYNSESFVFQSDSSGSLKWITTDTSGSTIFYAADGT